MAAIPKPQTPGMSPPETVEERFRRLEATWTAATGYLSDYSAIIEHPAFREIVGLGDAVVPLMLPRSRRTAAPVGVALPEITGANPVPSGDGGNIARMSEAWLRWGRAKGYQW